MAVKVAEKFTKLITEKDISELLRDMGMPYNLQGFDYTKEAIMIILSSDKARGLTTKTIYPEVAVKFNTTPSRIERNIRYSIEKTMEYTRTYTLNKVLKSAYSPETGKPTNSEFLFTVAEYLKMGEFGND